MIDSREKIQVLAQHQSILSLESMSKQLEPSSLLISLQLSVSWKIAISLCFSSAKDHSSAFSGNVVEVY